MDGHQIEIAVHVSESLDEGGSALHLEWTAWRTQIYHVRFAARIICAGKAAKEYLVLFGIQFDSFGAENLA